MHACGHFFFIKLACQSFSLLPSFVDSAKVPENVVLLEVLRIEIFFHI